MLMSRCRRGAEGEKTLSNTQSLIETVSVPSGINRKKNGTVLRSARQATMLTILGNPRADMNDECQGVANPHIKAMIVTKNVGPFGVTGLRPAVASLAGVMSDIKDQQPDLYPLLSSAGMLCVRHVRKVPTSISNHSWGIAIDLKISGVLDTWNDGTVQRGLTLIAPIFAEHDWYWGAAFTREDGMHFECSDDLIRKWAKEGQFGSNAPPAPEDGMLSLGDRGDEVMQLQARLNELGAYLLVDGIFGRETQSSVMVVQVRAGLSGEGVVDKKTRKAIADAKPGAAATNGRAIG